MTAIHALRRSRLAGLAGLASAAALAWLAAHADGLTAETGPPGAAPDPAMRALIDAFERGERRASQTLISFRGPDEQPLYLATAPCCDHFNGLYDRKGRRICAPSGGFSGVGDGTCPPWARLDLLQARIRLAPTPAAQQPSAPAASR